MIKPATFLLCVACAVSGCAVHHVTPYVPDLGNAPETAGAAEASSDCFEATTAADVSICASPALSATNLAMVGTLQSRLRTASVFARDAILAGQRAWLLALPAQCHLPDVPAPGPTAAGTACLQVALAYRTLALRALAVPDITQGGPIAQYVHVRDAAGAGRQPEPALCTSFAQRANAALSRGIVFDPAAMGFTEVAGTHGPVSAAGVSVDLYDANVYALFQRRARNVSLGTAPPVVTPVSLTRLAETLSPANQGGRFSALASQTGDYGSIDVFRSGTRRLVMAADPWGSTTPAAPGEAAHAGVWDLTGPTPIPVCLFDTYSRPAEPGVFAMLPSFTAWRSALLRIQESTDLRLSATTKRDQAQLNADSDFVVLHMPLLAVGQAVPWTSWLRHRHDDALDALFEWSTRDPANKALFDQAFALLRPAATELVHAYQTSQGLNAQEATQAGGIAIMELIYQATTTIAPGVGAAPGISPGYRARYPILAAPS